MVFNIHFQVISWRSVIYIFYSENCLHRTLLGVVVVAIVW